MRIVRIMLLAGAAIAAIEASAQADGAASPEAVNIDELATTTAPSLPAGSQLMSIARTPQPEVPGLPLSAREKAAFGDEATTLRILPSGASTSGASISWSGYSKAGVVYSGSN